MQPVRVIFRIATVFPVFLLHIELQSVPVSLDLHVGTFTNRSIRSCVTLFQNFGPMLKSGPGNLFHECYHIFIDAQVPDSITNLMNIM